MGTVVQMFFGENGPAQPVRSRDGLNDVSARRIDRYDRGACPRGLCDHLAGLHRPNGSCGICAAWEKTENAILPCAIAIIEGVTIKRGGLQPPTIDVR